MSQVENQWAKLYQFFGGKGRSEIQSEILRIAFIAILSKGVGIVHWNKLYVEVILAHWLSFLNYF